MTPVLVGGLLAAMPAAAAAAPDRVFELVSPPAKGGSDVSAGYFATPDGDAVAYESFASLGSPGHALFSSTYVARRATDGWKTTTMQAKVESENPTLLDATITAGLSADLTTAFSAGWGAFEAGDENYSQDIARVRGGVSEWVTPSLTLPDTNMVDSSVAGASEDGRYFVVDTTKPVLAGVTGSAPQLYLHGPNGQELASRLPNGLQSNGARLGNGRGFAADKRAISADGQTLFFSTTTGVSQLYVRRDGQTTLVSADTSGLPGTAAAVFQAATEDGSEVLFSSASQLTVGAPTGGGLYHYDVDADELRLVVAGTITGVMQTSDDLSVAYVVSTAQLQPGTGTTGQRNLYRVADGAPRFVATLDPQDVYGWNWGQGGNVGGVSSDGGRLVFQSRKVLAGANLGSFKTAVYRYDAANDELKCISCRPDGTVNVNGAALTSADLGFGATPGANPSRVTTADGRLAVFETADALLPEDENTLTDVYGYDDDGLHLISGGTPGGESHAIDITSDGRDVFFFSTAKLASEDTDQGYRDVYTARVGGGFPVVEQPCSAGTCERPDATPSTFTPVIGSTGVFDETIAQPAAPKVGFRVSSISAASRRSWARTGRTSLSVRVTAGARITATTKLGRKTVSTVRATRSIPGTAKLTLKLSKAARAQLKRKGRLKLTVTVSVSGAAKASKATVTLTAPKAKKQAGR